MTIMMKKFFVSDGNEIINFIMAANRESAEAVSPNLTVLDVEDYPNLDIGYRLVAGAYLPPADEVVEA